MERKLATVLFVDLVDSTGLVASADPEVVRRRVSAYFERVSHCIEEFGGKVEKFAGDAVMAAFGVPLTHEDDAERALRAAFAVMDTVHELGLEGRIGVEAGEVVIESAESTFATGDPVNVAARLQQGAAPGEIRLGPGARRLAAGAVEVEDAGPLEIRGRTEPVWSWRAVRIADGRRRRPSAPFVGRDGELELVRNTLARAVRSRRPHLLTVFGDPGVGKTRLVSEFTEGVERATVLWGPALPYGEGVTYWPLASMIKASAGIRDDDPANEAFEKLRVSCESDAVADLLALALGVLGAAEAEGTREELSWAVLQWAEQLADAQPLVLVFEDLHWADERLLELVEQLAQSLRDLPVLIVCVSRPDLLEFRPTWGGGNPRATAVELGALDEDESEELASSLLRETAVPPAQRALLLEKAEGNPLFLEETARMLAEAAGDGAALERIPDTLQALIAARIDRLEPEQKLLLQRAALIGRIFWRGALDDLSAELEVSTLLDALLEREFVVPQERSSISGDRAFQFTHVLIREVAYASTSKAQRAVDHRRLAEWIAAHGRDELVEIRAYHLDRAATLVAELEGTVPTDLAHEAAAALEQAGDRSLRRESFAGARRMLLRANELETSLSRRYLAARAASRMSDFDVARPELMAVQADAHAAGDGAVEGSALLVLAFIDLNRDSDVQRARELATEALRVLDPDDDRAQYEAQLMLARVGWWTGDLQAAQEHARKTLELARRLGRADLESRSLSDLAHARAEDDHEEALRLFAQALALADESESLDARADVLIRRAQLESEQRRFDDARASLEEAQALFREIGSMAQVGWALATIGEVELAAGELDAAERSLREAVRILSPLRHGGNLVEAQRQLADVMLARGRIEEAERYALAANETVGREDAWSRALTLSGLGLVRAAQGREEEAETLLREAVAIGDSTGYHSLRRRLKERLEVFERERSGMIRR
jgi:class 3 adenylate cyclase/tetratricopeptide (TPR) repeat protein